MNSPFEGALQEAHTRLLAAHSAAVATLEAELQHMRMENMRLRLRLAEAGLVTHATEAQALKASPAVQSTPPMLSVPPAEPQRTQPSEEAAVQVQEGIGAEGPIRSSEESAVSDPHSAPGAVALQEEAPTETPARIGKSDLPVESSEKVHSPQDSVSSGNVVLALGALLRRYGLQGLPISQHLQARSSEDEGAWTVAGRTLLIRQRGCDLEASGDGGQSWELLEALFVQNLAQLQALKRDADIVPRTAQLAEASCHLQPQARPSRKGQSSQDYSQQAPRILEPVTGRGPASGPAGPAGDHAADGLPAWRPDGLPTFHNAFPQSFSAMSGATQYYSQFRVRVPTASQYESGERPG